MKEWFGIDCGVVDMEERRERHKGLYFDRKITATAIIALITFVLSSVWALADSRTQLINMQLAVAKNTKASDKVLTMEGTIEGIKDDVTLIKNHLIKR